MNNLPPNLFPLIRGDMTCGFKCDQAGTPYLLSYISYRGSENLLDNKPDNGRSFQSDAIDGKLHLSHPDFRFDMVNPTQGGGDYGRIKPVVEECVITYNTIDVILPALDYSPDKDYYNGPYRTRMISGRYPVCGWKCGVTYTVTDHSVEIKTIYWHEDIMAHYVHQFRPAIVYLNTDLFQYPLVNEEHRNLFSWLRALINNTLVRVISKDKQIQVTFSGGITNGVGVINQRQFIESNPTELDKTGKADVWEAMVVGTYNTWIRKEVRLEGYGRLDLQPTKVKFDLRKFRAKFLAAIKGRGK